MKEFLLTGLGRLRLVAILEGVLFPVPLLVAMLLKYLAGQPQAIQPVGIAHGVLFVLYVLLQQSIARSWPLRTAVLWFVASLGPLGIFWTDHKLFQPKTA